uniref:Serine/threonine-protein phosphatase 4 regulatory subunit 3 n=1 Tax=Sinocyclocheilus anshuiensis TaxID=1608454 RepID=A0A671QUK0_9TELE
MTDTRRRVKVYTLNEDRQWDDRGTGHVSSAYVERLKGMSLLVRAESDGSLLLESKINPNTAYQKQQDTLIVWSEAENYDLALSFQEKAGCDEIWEKICQVTYAVRLAMCHCGFSIDQHRSFQIDCILSRKPCLQRMQ